MRKTNKISLVLGMVVVMLGLNSVASAAEMSFAFIDLDGVFNDFYKTKQADEQLKEAADEFGEERKSLVDSYKKLQDDFAAAREAAQNTALSEEVRAEKRDAAEELLVEMREQEGRVRRFEESKKKQLDLQGRRMRKRIVDEIRGEIDNYAEENGLDAVIDRSGQSLNSVEIILYTNPKIDITENIVSILNKGQK